MTFSITEKKMAIGRIPQTNYATATAGASNAYDEQIVTDPDGSFWVREAKKINNKGHSTGNRWATESHVEAWDTMISYNFEASAQNLGKHLLAVLGAVSSEELDTDYHGHNFIPLNTASSMQVPVYSFVEKLSESNSGINDLYPSAACESLELSGDGQGRVSASASWRGSGKKSSASGVTWASHVNAGQGNQNFFYNTQANISIGTFPSNGSPAQMGCDLESWKFAYKNTFAADAGYRPGCPDYAISGDPESGVQRTEMLLSDSEMEFEFTIRLQASDPRVVHFQNQTALEGSIQILGGNVSGADTPAALNIIFSLLKYDSHVKSAKDGIVLVTIKPEILYSRTDSSIVTIELNNDVESYTT